MQLIIIDGRKKGESVNAYFAHPENIIIAMCGKLT